MERHLLQGLVALPQLKKIYGFLLEDIFIL